MIHVTTETATVYRCALTRRRYYSKRWAYYAQAKAMVLAKYPSPEDPRHIDYYIEHGTREVKRVELFHTFTEGSIFEPDGDFFDVDKWQLVVERVASFLKFVDKRRSANSPNPLDEMAGAMGL